MTIDVIEVVVPGDGPQVIEVESTTLEFLAAKQAAQTAASDAEDSATAAAASATAAASSATSATGSASSASTSASEASTSASNASSSETAAASSASDAAASATAAATSETNAATNASNASDSETAASGYASAASISASNASSSASTAGDSATAADASASDASDSADLAEQWANEDEDVVVSGGEYSARHYAAKASASATSASGSASDASTSAENAATSETNASSSASDAASAQTAAETAATNAQNYASTAKSLTLYQAYKTDTSDADPGSGNFRLNGAVASATEAYISTTAGQGGDISSWLDTWDDSTGTVKGTLTLVNAADRSVWAVYQISSVTTATGYRKVGITYVSGNGSFDADDEFSFEFTRAGDKGDTGAKGDTGSPGDKGDTGDTATITVGTVTTLDAGSSATVTNSGTSEDAVFDFGIPKGADGAGAGDVVGPSSASDGHIVLFDGTTGKLLKDSTSTPASFATADQGALADSSVQPGDLATVATSGAYGDLTGTPSLATVATSGSYSDLSGIPTLGSAASSDTTDFATAAEGALAGTSLQPDDIGYTVQAYDANTLKADTDDTLTAGYVGTIVNDGTKSSGTYTPSPTGGNFRKIVNGGAFTLAAPTATGDFTMIVQVTNNGSAGAITLSGFSVTPDGDDFTTTNGDDFLVYITKANSFKQATVKALQ